MPDQTGNQLPENAAGRIGLSQACYFYFLLAGRTENWKGRDKTGSFISDSASSCDLICSYMRQVLWIGFRGLRVEAQRCVRQLM